VTKRYILYIQQTCLKGQIGTYTARNTLVQLLALYTNAESHNVQRHRQTDGRQDDANSRSYYVAVRSAKNKRAVQNLAKSQCNDADWWINHLITVYFPHDFESRLTIEQFYRTFITFHWPMVQCAHCKQKFTLICIFCITNTTCYIKYHQLLRDFAPEPHWGTSVHFRTRNRTQIWHTCFQGQSRQSWPLKFFEKRHDQGYVTLNFLALNGFWFVMCFDFLCILLLFCVFIPAYLCCRPSISVCVTVKHSHHQRCWSQNNGGGTYKQSNIDTPILIFIL